MKKPPPTTADRLSDLFGMWCLAFVLLVFATAVVIVLAYGSWIGFWWLHAHAPWVLWGLLSCALCAIIPASIFAFGGKKATT